MMTDEELARLLTAAYDEKLNDAKITAAALASTRSLRRAAEAPETDPAPKPIEERDGRKRRWVPALAAVLALVLLAGGGWLLSRRLVPKASPAATGEPLSAVPRNCHAEELAGETVYILDSDYDGEYHLQKWSERNLENALGESAYVQLSEWPPADFERLTVLSYADYAAYCETWGLEQKYEDPDQFYLVYAWCGYQGNPADCPRLSDVVRMEEGYSLCLWKPAAQVTSLTVTYPVAWVLTVPVEETADSADVWVWYLMTDTEYEQIQEALRTPRNCHAADLNGQTVYVLDDEEARYDGEYDLQQVNEDDFFAVVIDGPLEAAIPKGFTQQTIMTYADYAAYCEKWSLEQKYEDPDQSYLVYAWAFSDPADRPPFLADVVISGRTASVYQWYRKEDGVRYARYPAVAWVLTVPVPAEVTAAEAPRVLTEAEYAYQADLYRTTLETLPDGRIRITGFPVNLFWSSVPGDDEYIAVWLQNGGDTLVLCVDDDTKWRKPDGTAFTRQEYTEYDRTEYGQPRPRLCIVAENCQLREGVDYGIFYFPHAYYAERLTLYFGDEADQAFTAAEFPLGLPLSALREDYGALIVSDYCPAALPEENGNLPENSPEWPVILTLGIAESVYEGGYVLFYTDDETCCGAFHVLPDGTLEDLVGRSIREDLPCKFQTGEELLQVWGESLLQFPDPETGWTDYVYMTKQYGAIIILYDEEYQSYNGFMHAWPNPALRPSPREYADRRAAAAEGMDPDFAPLSEEEIRAAIEAGAAPDTENRYILFEGSYGSSAKYILFSYRQGYCLAAWHPIEVVKDEALHYEPNLLCCLLFDSEMTLRQTVVGAAADLPETGALREALLGKTRAEIVAAFGGLTARSELSLYTAAILMTADGRVVIVPDVERGGSDAPVESCLVCSVFTGEEQRIPAE